jgi:hypothetical protein
LIAADEPQNFERSALRWLERFVSEKAKSVDDVGAAVDALAERPIDLPGLLRLSADS